MSVMYRINSHLRKKLHEPFGILLKGSIIENKEKLDEIIKKIQPVILISVGDMVSRELSEQKYNPKIIALSPHDSSKTSLQAFREAFPDESQKINVGEKIVI